MSNMQNMAIAEVSIGLYRPYPDPVHRESVALI